MDLQIAKDKLMEDQDLKLVYVLGGEVLYSSKDRGIKPMYDLVKKFSHQEGGAVADRVIGRGAGILSLRLKLDGIYGQLMSRSALDVFKKQGSYYEYGELCDNILNREGSGLCPIESLSLGIEDVETMVKAIENFLEGRVL